MSTIIKFTVRDLNRRTAEVLTAAKTYGSVQICARTGEVFTLVPEARVHRSKTKAKEKTAAEMWAEKSAERKARMIAIGYVPPTADEWDTERFNRIIAGEE
jgi:antitoxin (DNA-binding transcriptional repressor) of toxin-antitoxin stability system